MSKLSLEVFKDEKAPAIALLSCVIKTYGVEAFDWEPEILRAEIERDFDMTLSDLQSDKIQAAVTVIASPFFQEQWEVFEKICHMFNGVPDEFDTANPLEAEEIAQAMADYYLLNYDDQEAEHKPEQEGMFEDPSVFSDEIRAYCGRVFYEYGCHSAPTIFPTALLPDGVVPGDNTEKDGALKEIFDARLEYVTNYIKKLTQEE